MNKHYFKPGKGVVEDPDPVDNDMVELEETMVINGRQTELDDYEYFKTTYDEWQELDEFFDGTIRQLTADEKTERERLLKLVKQANALLAEAEKGGVDVWGAIQCWAPSSAQC